MFGFNKKYSISPEMLRYINESTNKSLDKYTNKNKTTILSCKPFHFENTQRCKGTLSNFIVLFPFISFVSFLAGYNFHKLLKN